TAEEMRDRLGEAVHTASERLGEMREVQRINADIRTLNREKDRCHLAMIDLLMRMFDQNTFAEALLRPEYNRVKEIDAAIAKLEEERKAVGAQAEEAAPSVAPIAIAEIEAAEEAAEVDMNRCE
ncbi:MAG TPA: hypothetical protein VGM23_16780, partial [Armatimonadota bacterium]